MKKVELFCSPLCPHCPKAHAMAVPCLAVNDEIKLIGWPFTLEDISKAIQ